MKSLGKKVIVLVLMGTTTMAAFAITGDGKGKRPASKRTLLTNKPMLAPGSFSLRTGYQFRGSQILSTQDQFITLNTVVSYQRGHSSVIMPLKKKVVLNDKIVFNPNAATRR